MKQRLVQINKAERIHHEQTWWYKGRPLGRRKVMLGGNMDSTKEWRTLVLGFPGGAVAKNLPANAGDTASSPGTGRSHTLRSNYAHAPQLMSLRSRARKPQLLSLHATTTEACMPRARALQQEKPPQWEACTPPWRVAPALLITSTRESLHAATKNQCSQKKKKEHWYWSLRRQKTVEL